MKFESIKKLENKYVMQTFARFDVAFVRGEGIKLYDTEGKEYYDFLAGIATNLLGYNDKKLVSTIAKQSKKIMHASNFFYSEVVSKYARDLLKNSDFARVFFSNSGAEANECAMKATRKYFKNKNEDKFKLISCKNSFHGRTIATATLTGQPKYSTPFAPLLDGVEYCPYNDFETLKMMADDSTAGIFVELIQGEGGVRPADIDYIKNIEKLCKERNILFVIDEVQTGMGRTGKMFCYQNYGIKPDIITLAKGIAGGFPMGATLFNKKTQNAFDVGDHGSTFGGNILACASASCVLDRLQNTDLLQNVAENGKYFEQKLQNLVDKFDFVLQVRGIGLLLGLEIDKKIAGRQIVEKMMQKGFIINCAGGNTLRFCPPLIVTKKDIDLMCEALDEVLQTFVE